MCATCYIAHMSDQNRDQRIPILLTPKELERLDDWMFGRRIRSRGEAIRRLMEFGYQHEGAKAPKSATAAPDDDGLSEDEKTALKAEAKRIVSRMGQR